MSSVPKLTPSGDQHARQLKHDRMVAAIVFAVFAALMALMIWLASLNGGPAEPIDYWPMMP